MKASIILVAALSILFFIGASPVFAASVAPLEVPATVQRGDAENGLTELAHYIVQCENVTQPLTLGLLAEAYTCNGKVEQAKDLLAFMERVTRYEDDRLAKFMGVLTLSYTYERFSPSLDPDLVQSHQFLKAAESIFETVDLSKKGNWHYYFLACMQAKLGFSDAARTTANCIADDFFKDAAERIKLRADLLFCSKKFEEAKEQYRAFLSEVEKGTTPSKGYRLLAVMGSLNHMGFYQSCTAGSGGSASPDPEIKEISEDCLVQLKAWKSADVSDFYRVELLCCAYSYLNKTEQLKSSLVTYLNYLIQASDAPDGFVAEGLARAAKWQSITGLELDEDLQACIRQLLKQCDQKHPIE
jgi:hypothetical protein